MAHEQRKLAAILAADVVGYSRLMGRDEAGTFARLRRNRVERLDPVLARYGGRLVKLTGDGALVEFGSAVGALSAAIEFQQSVATSNVDEPEATALTFRIGVHLGDLIVEDDDLYGDGINVAARLEAEAPAGGIVVSRAIYDAVGGRLKATFFDLGELALKNIERPVQAFGVQWRAADWLAPSDSATSIPSFVSSAPAALPLPDRPSIAVLPFQNMGRDPDQEYFADGMVEDIITALSRFKSLFVIARNSTFTYKGRAVDIKQVGRDLGVRYVLEGSIRNAGGRVRITGQLIESESGTHLWAEHFDGALQDIFELQDQVTAKVVTALAPRVEQAEIARSRRKAVSNLSAYDCYLRGLSFGRVTAPDSLDKALAQFLRAIELDPDHSAAYGMAMTCYAHRKGFARSDDLVRDHAEVARLSRIALEVGRDDAMALANTAYAVAFVLHDLPLAKSSIDEALSLNQNLANAWAASGWIHLWNGEPQVAVEHLGRAIRHDPLRTSFITPMRSALAHAHFFLNQHEEALSWAEKQLQDTPLAHPALRIGIASAAFAGKDGLARELAGRLQATDPSFRVSRLKHYLGPYNAACLDRYTEGLRLAGLPE